MVTTSVLDSGEGRLAIHDWGGVGPPVLLAHPTGFHGRAWAPVADRLVARGRTVWSFDFRGHGDSDRSRTDYQWQGFASDALAVARHLGLDGDPDLLAVGHSKGGASLILGEADAPGTYARIWAYEPIIFPTDDVLPPDPEFPLAVSARRRRFVWASREQAYDAYRSKPPLSALSAEALRAYVEYGLRDRDDGQVELKCLPDDEAAVYTMGGAHGAYARLDVIGCPVAVVCGEHTDAIVPKLAEMITARLQHGSLEIMGGLGHFGPFEDPDAVVVSMLRFARQP